jgi:hypothetical protein
MRRLLVVLLSVGCLAAVPLAAAGASQPHGYRGVSGFHGYGGPPADNAPSSVVFPPQSQPLGLSYSKWAARWSQWAFGTPTPENPLADPAANCNVAQRGPAFFLPAPSGPGTLATCTVSAGEPILLTPAGTIETPGEGVANTFPAVLAAAKAGTDVITNIAATLDGRSLPIQGFRTASPFVLFLPSDNILGGPAGPNLAAINGYFLMLKPLCGGTHTITTTDTFSDGSTADITITLKVLGPQPHWG